MATPLRIGIDIDGVLAAFVPAYQALFVKLTGRDLFLPGDNIDPPCWDWPQFRGYTSAEVKQVWDTIKRDPTFWMNLKAHDGASTVKMMLLALESAHELYFITSRPGIRVKRQTEIWLIEQLNYAVQAPRSRPTVLIAGYRMKGELAKGLGLDVYLDDNFDNVQDCAEKSPLTRTYLLDCRYNQEGDLNPLVVRVRTVGEMFDHEISNL